jgi:hypothetical protein
VLYLTRSAQEWQQTQPALELLRQYEVPHHVLTPAECAAFEHSVPTDPEFAGGVLFDQERTANCPLFTKLIKQTLDTQGGVQFMLNREVAAIRLDGQRAAVELAPRLGEVTSTREVDVINADAVVVAAGTGTLPLLERLGLRVPLHPLRLHTLSAPIAHEECAPHVAIVDAVKRITITRMNHRLRIAGGAVLQGAGQADKPLSEAVTKDALALLGQATHDWIPGAAKISAALSWDGLKLLSPDGLPQCAASAPVRQCRTWAGRLGARLRGRQTGGGSDRRRHAGSARRHARRVAAGAVRALRRLTPAEGLGPKRFTGPRAFNYHGSSTPSGGAAGVNAWAQRPGPMLRVNARDCHDRSHTWNTCRIRRARCIFPRP